MKAIALAVAAFLILAIAGVGSALALQVVKGTTEVAVTPGQLFVVLLTAWPLIMAFMMMGLFLGAFLPNRRIAALVLAVIFIASYFGKNLAGMVESLEPIRPLSLFYYFDSSSAVFTEGVKASDVMVLLGAAAIFYVLALLSFQRRNVTVGAWPWQRGRARQHQEGEQAA
jgi:ABC-2 type transport system permease protein